LLSGIDGNGQPRRRIGSTPSRTRDENTADGAAADKNTAPMDFHGALGALRTVIKERPDTILVNEGANTSIRARRHRHLRRAGGSMSEPGRDGHRHGLCHRGRGRDRQAGARSRRRPAFGFSAWRSRRSVLRPAGLCRHFNNNGIYRGTDTNAAGRSATTVRRSRH
jgi:oxalyl-CoA decarboxylase